MCSYMRVFTVYIYFYFMSATWVPYYIYFVLYLSFYHFVAVTSFFNLGAVFLPRSPGSFLYPASYLVSSGVEINFFPGQTQTMLFMCFLGGDNYGTSIYHFTFHLLFIHRRFSSFKITPVQTRFYLY